MTIIPKSILDKIRAWATPPFDQSQNIDGKLVQLLLVKIVGMTDLAANNVSDNVKAFIEGINCIYEEVKIILRQYNIFSVFRRSNWCRKC